MKFEKEFVSLIKKKSELSLLDDDYVLKCIHSHSFPSMEKYISFDQATRNKKVKQSVREVRAYLRKVYGLFLKEQSITHQSDFLQLLSLHRSTDERLPYYSVFYDKLFSLLDSLGLPEFYTLFDVACGYNPLAYTYLPRQPSRYVACDLSSKEMNRISDLTPQHISCFGTDVLSSNFMSWLVTQTFDVVFFFKALDSFESVQRHSSKALLDACAASLIVVTFPLQSIEGKKSIHSDKRVWLEHFCTKQSWGLHSFQIPNELVYVIVK